MKKNKNTTKILIIILSVIAVIAAAGAIYVGIQNQKMKEQSKRQPKQEQTESSSHITYQGKKYEYNGNLRTLLFLGVDKDEEVTVKETTGHLTDSQTALFCWY